MNAAAVVFIVHDVPVTVRHCIWGILNRSSQRKIKSPFFCETSHLLASQAVGKISGGGQQLCARNVTHQSAVADDSLHLVEAHLDRSQTQQQAGPPRQRQFSGHLTVARCLTECFAFARHCVAFALPMAVSLGGSSYPERDLLLLPLKCGCLLFPGGGQLQRAREALNEINAHYVLSALEEQKNGMLTARSVCRYQPWEKLPAC